jgi:8-amino-7-oxononanoate synthase
LGDALAELERRGLRRDECPTYPEGAVVLCSNDYLGYAADPLSSSPAPGGAGASRLVTGDHAEHRTAERALAGWVGTESALLFSSGYAANCGALTALAGPGDVIVSDRLNHASIIDGCRLSGARVLIVPHADATAVEGALRESGAARRRWVVTESYFSMDGDEPDLVKLRAHCDAYDAGLIVDEAHALGVFGPGGAGICAEVGVRPDVLVGGLGKAIGLQGGFVAGPSELRSWLWNRARPFVFSTGLSPSVAGAVEERVTRIQGDEARRRRLHGSAAMLRALVGSAGSVSPGRGPIIPWVLGDVASTMRAAATLRAQGVIASAIRPPTVPEGASRIRITASARLTDQELERVAAAFRCFT